MIRIFSYSRESNRLEIPGLTELPRYLADRSRMLWVDMEDPTDEETGVLGGIFGFHALAVEDCMHEGHLPKVDLYDGVMFMILHAVDPGLKDGVFGTQVVDFFMGGNYLVTYHKKLVKGIFDARGQVAKNPGSLLRSPDWLLYGLVDSMIDHYRPGLEQLNARIDGLEARVLDLPDAERLNEILRLKREVFHLRRVAAPQQEILRRLGAGDLSWIADENRVYFRGIYGHFVQAAHAADMYGERLAGEMELYLALVSSRTERAVKMLTAVVGVVAPLMLVAQVYEMHVQHLLGAGERGGYVAVLCVMGVLAAGMLAAFKKKRWF